MFFTLALIVTIIIRRKVKNWKGERVVVPKFLGRDTIHLKCSIWLSEVADDDDIANYFQVKIPTELLQSC